ncbi:MAG TPA: carboxypeptidase M32 [Trueperaceae bacterium]
MPGTTADSSTRTALEALQEELGILTDLQQAASLLSWDQHTYMPPGAASTRAQQLATLSKLTHERLTGSGVKDPLEALRDAEFAPDSDEAALLRLTRREVDRATKLPAGFVEEFARLRSSAQQTWAQARQDDDFGLFRPQLERILDMTRQEADYLGYQDHPYDALLDQYEPGMKTAKVKEVFAELRQATVALVHDIVEGGAPVSDAPLHQFFDESVQEQFGIEVVSDYGYDFTRGRLDLTIHPFAEGIGKNDVRITTRYDQHFLSTALFGTMHEAGHGMYEQGITDAYQRSPLGDAASLGMHESQSRMWENLVGRSDAFWQHGYPRLQELFPQLQDVSRRDFYAAVNRVEPSLIRVEADEVTYNLHIMVRFELELAMLEGRLSPAELPDAWNTKYEEYLGIRPASDTQGCLQDIHWAMGAIGYFPTYALGNIMSVQLYQAAKRAHPQLEDDIRAGRFGTLLGWLRENVHRWGAKYQPEELLRRATGSELDAKPYIAYLNHKFRALYQVEP